MAENETRERAKGRHIGEILDQTDALKKHIEATGTPPIEELELFMDTLKEAIISLSMGDLARAAGGMKKLSSFGTSELFQGIGEITRDLHESIKDIQSFLEPILKHINEEEIEGLSNKLAHVSKLVKDAAEQTLDLLFARQEVALIDVNMYEMIVKLIAEGDKKGAVAKLATLKVHNDELVNELTRISELQIHADLVDQLIKKVSKVVEEIERRLIEFIQHFGHLVQAESKAEHPKVEVLHGPVVPGRVKGAATSQDAVDDLLKSLGM
jgi:chemotaxis protein CheZ